MARKLSEVVSNETWGFSNTLEDSSDSHVVRNMNVDVSDYFVLSSMYIFEAYDLVCYQTFVTPSSWNSTNCELVTHMGRELKFMVEAKLGGPSPSPQGKIETTYGNSKVNQRVEIFHGDKTKMENLLLA